MAQQATNSDCPSTTDTDDIVNETINGTLSSTGYSDMHDLLVIRVSSIISACVVLTFNVMALIALNRTRGLPKAARVLSSSLLWFDAATLFTSVIRNMVTDSYMLNIITMTGLTMSSASFSNIAIMSLDRLILFQWPFFYVRHFINGSYVAFYYVVIVGFLLFFSYNWIECFFTMTSFWVTRQCLVPVIVTYKTISHVVSVLLCVPCFIWIAIIVVKQQRKERSRSETKPTIVVLVCCINYAITTVVILVFLFTHCSTSIIFRRTGADVLYMFNSLVDTSVYVMWFKECRYELLRIIGCLVPPLRQRLTRMRTEVSALTLDTTPNIVSITN